MRSRGPVAALAVLLLLPAALTARQRPAPHNVLWITVEDITTTIGAYGDPLARTPNIDRLAREGILYTRAYTVSGVCAPSRASFITGMYPTSVGAHHMRALGAVLRSTSDALRVRPQNVPPYSVVLPAAVKAFPEYLRRAGWYTTNNSKTDYQFEAPVTVWDDNGPAASYRNRPAGAPFFAVYNFFVTHESQIALQSAPLRTDPAAVAVPPIYPDTPAIRGDLARLYDNVEIMDRQVGELLAMLETDGLSRTTHVFLFADNGGNLPWFKREVLERGTRVPLIVRLAGGGELAARHRAGERSDELVSGVDLAPTVLSLAGVELPAHLQGQAFLGEQRARTPRRYVFGARDRMDSEYDRVRMVRDARYRYLYNYEPEKPRYQDIQFRLMLSSMKSILELRDQGTLGAATAAWFAAKPVEELYDVERDPWELRNLAADPGHEAKLEELRAAFQDWTLRYGDLGAVPEDVMVRGMWHGASEPPATATPVVRRGRGGVRIACATPGASIGYWIERGGRAAKETTPTTHVVRSWDSERLAVEGGRGAGLPEQGDVLAEPRRFTVYDGEAIRLRGTDVLHVNAMRIGYRAASIDYAPGRGRRSADEERR